MYDIKYSLPTDGAEASGPRQGRTSRGERTVRIRKVVGSIPIRSTIHRKRRSENCGVFSFDHRNTTDGFLL